MEIKKERTGGTLYVDYSAELECGCKVTGSAHPRSQMMAGSERTELHCGRHGLQWPTKIDILEGGI